MIAVRGGKPLHLDAASVLGVGGEATVFAIDGATVAKVWHAPSRAHTRKLHTLLARRDLPVELAAPIEPLLAPKGSAVVGFVLPRVPDPFAPLATLLRKTPRPNVATIATTFVALAELVARLHRVGVVIGDLSDQNVLVAGGEARLIDVDSFQLDGEACPVATEAYLDPALYGVDLARAAAFRPENDRYALAVLLFRALFAAHPYGGAHPTLPTLAARARARIWAFSPDVVYPSKVALPKNVVSDELLAWFEAQLAGGAREALPVDALARHAAAIARCAGCGTEAPRTRATCPACSAARPSIAASAAATTRVDHLFSARGDIVHVDVIDGATHVFAEEDGVVASYRLFAGSVARRVLGPAGIYVRAFAVDADAIVYAERERVIFVAAGGAAELTTSTTTFDGAPVVARLGRELVRATSATLVRARPFRDTFVERALAPVLPAQTQIFSGRDALLGVHRIFSRLSAFRVTASGRVDLALPALDAGEALRELAMHDDGERTVVLRRTTRGGVATTRVDLFDARGGLACGSVCAAESDPTRREIRGRVLSGTTLYHPTDDGIARESLTHAAIGPVTLVAGTASISADTALLFAHPRGLVVASGRDLFLVSKSLSEHLTKETPHDPDSAPPRPL